MELPKELPLVRTTSSEYELPEVWAFRKKAFIQQRDASQNILNKWVEAYQQALSRIEELEKQLAELEAIEKQHQLFNGELRVENASLQEQLAVFTKDIPKGEYCYVREKSNNTWCEHEIGGSCHLLGVTLDWQRDYDAYTKAPGCPVPAKEDTQ
jgi:hypothetical protein